MSQNPLQLQLLPQNTKRKQKHRTFFSYLWKIPNHFMSALLNFSDAAWSIIVCVLLYILEFKN